MLNFYIGNLIFILITILLSPSQINISDQHEIEQIEELQRKVLKGEGQRQERKVRRIGMDHEFDVFKLNTSKHDCRMFTILGSMHRDVIRQDHKHELTNKKNKDNNNFTHLNAADTTWLTYPKINKTIMDALGEENEKEFGEITQRARKLNCLEFSV